MSALTCLQTEYNLSYAGVFAPGLEPQVRTDDGLVPGLALLNNAAQNIAPLIEQVKDFLDSSGLMIIDLLNYAKRIILEPLFPKKLTLAKQCVSALLQKVQRLIELPNSIRHQVDNFVNTLLIPLQQMGGHQINLSEVLESSLKIVFFEPFLKAAVNLIPPIGPFPAREPFSSQQNAPEWNPLPMMQPYIQLIVQTIAAPLTIVKAILDPFKPIWDFVKSLLKLNPMKIIKAIGKIPAIFSKLISFLQNLASAFSNPPLSVFNLLGPVFESLLQPIIQVSSNSDGPDSLSSKLPLLFPAIIEMISSFFSGGNIRAVLFEEGGLISRLGPIAGIVIQLYVFIKGTVMGAIKYLIAPILSIIGISLDFGNTTDTELIVGFAPPSGDPQPSNLTEIQVYLGNGTSEFYNKMTVLNQWGLIDNIDRLDEFHDIYISQPIIIESI